MTDVTVTPIASGYNLQKINTNFDTLAAAINNEVMHLVGGNNTMQQDIDMNSNRLLNLPAPASGSEPARLQEILDLENQLLQIVSADINFNTVADLKSLTLGESVLDIASLAADQALVSTKGFYSRGDRGGALYLIKTLTQHRLDIGNPSWVPDGNGDHYLLGGTTYVAVLSPVAGAWIPQWFGVRGDGVTDDSILLSAVSTYVSNLGGGTILLPDAVYAIGTGNSSRGFTVKSGVSVVGSSRGGTILRRKLGSNTKVLSIASDTSGLPAVRTTNVEVTNLTLDGQGQNETVNPAGGAHQTWEYGYNVDIRHASFVKVHGCNILNPIGDGFYIAMRSTDIHVFNNYISSTEAYNNTRNTRMGIAMLSGKNIYIYNNVIKDFLWYIDGEIDTTEQGFTGDGKGFFGFKNIHIYGNDCITESTFSTPEGGVYLYAHPSNGPTVPWGCEDIFIHDNNIGQNQRSGIRVDGYSQTFPSKRVIISNNTIFKNYEGIALNRPSDFSISDNIIRLADVETLTGYSIRVFEIPNATFIQGSITGNDCYKAEIANIRVEGTIPSTKNLVISGNKCWNDVGLNIATSGFNGRLVIQDNDLIATGTFSNISLAATLSSVDTPVYIKGNVISCNSGVNIGFGNNNYVYVEGNTFVVGNGGSTGGRFYANDTTTAGMIIAKGNTYADRFVGFTNKNINLFSRITNYNVNRFALTEDNVAPQALTLGGDRFARPQTAVSELTFNGNSLRTIDSPHSEVTILFKDAGTVDHQLATGANSVRTSTTVNVARTAGSSMTFIRDSNNEWWETNRT